MKPFMQIYKQHNNKLKIENNKTTKKLKDKKIQFKEKKSRIKPV